jgi:hypothetical protein
VKRSKQETEYKLQRDKIKTPNQANKLGKGSQHQPLKTTQGIHIKTAPHQIRATATAQNKQQQNST